MIWRGIVADTTDVDETEGVSSEQFNTRMRIEGELQRRYGFLSSNLPPEDGPILGLASGSGFIVTGTSSEVGGVTDPTGIEVGPTFRPPVVVPFRQGSAWSVSEPFPPGFPDQYIIGIGTCAGVVSLTFDAGAPGTFQATVTNLSGQILDQRNITSGGSPFYDVVVPYGSGALFVTLGEHASWIIIGESLPGCG